VLWNIILHISLAIREISDSQQIYLVRFTCQSQRTGHLHYSIAVKTKITKHRPCSIGSPGLRLGWRWYWWHQGCSPSTHCPHCRQSGLCKPWSFSLLRTIQWLQMFLTKKPKSLKQPTEPLIICFGAPVQLQRVGSRTVLRACSVHWAASQLHH
jgi:hypothetical protein